ncbi:MAG: MFS transporter [Planctomycetes bacterium]|nr:MFS transporter [Planctomycetota bacterium]
METARRPFIRRNYYLGVANGALFYLSSYGLINTTIVIPPFVYLLAHRAGVGERWGQVMVGLVNSLSVVGWLWPQIIFSNIIEPFERKKPFYVVSALLRIVVFSAIPLGIVVLAGPRPLVLFWVVALALFLYTSFGGIGLLPFMDIVSKSMPDDMRGRFFGARAFWGCLLAFAGGILVKRILNPQTGLSYPNNYLTLFLMAWGIMAVGVFLFFLTREPPGRPRKVKVTLAQQFRRGPRLLKRDRDFLRIFITRMVLGLTAIASPFYVLYARERFSVGDADVGLFVASQVIFAGLAALACGRIGDTFGNKVLMILSAITCFIAPAMALLIKAIPAPGHVFLGQPFHVWAFCGVFAMIGFAQSGTTISALNYLLDIAPERRRPTYLGVMYTATAPLTFVPVLGGVLVGRTSYEFVFVLAGLFSLFLIVSAVQLREPRRAAARAAASVIGVPLFRPVRWIGGKLTLRRRGPRQG